MQSNDYIYYNDSITIHDYTLSPPRSDRSVNMVNEWILTLREQVQRTCSIYTRFLTTEHLT